MSTTTHSSNKARTVLELQELAQTVVVRPKRRRRGPSRSARLQLIDILSRWAGSGLALYAGVAVFLSVTVGRAYPLRAVVWTGLVLIALFWTRRLLKAFRAGEASASRPFRWRANYTASLCVLSAAFGAGGLILAPKDAPMEFVYQSLALLVAASLGAGVANAAHGRSAMAASLPAAALISLAAIGAVGLHTALLGVGAAALTGGATLFLFHSYLRQKITRRFPRTTILRREMTAEAPESKPFEAPAAVMRGREIRPNR